MYYNNKTLAISIFWIVLGIALVGLSIAEILDSSVYVAMGSALATIGALKVARNVKYRKNTEYKEKVDTEVKDERNRFLRMKSWSITGYAVVLAAAIGSLVAYFAGNELVQQVLLYVVCFTVFVYWVSYMVVSRKY